MRPSGHLAIFVLFAAGCGADGSRTTPPPTVTLPVASATSVTSAAPSRERLIAHAACEGLSPCTVVAVRPVLEDRGTEQLIAIVARGITGEPGIAPPTELPEVHSFDGEADVFAASYLGCTGYDAWVLTFDGTRARRVRLLTHVCNDGHGAAGVGEDRLSVKDGRIVLEQSGGSNWRWSQSSTMTIDRGVLETRRTNWFTMGEDASEGWWDYVGFRGAASWSAARCDANGQPPASDPEVLTFLHHPIPRVEVDEALRRDGGTAVALERCATTFDGASQGFALGGGKVAPSASFRVVAWGTDLFVEIEDDDFTTDGARHDRLELWSSKTPPGANAPCVAAPQPASGASIEMSAGRVSSVGARTSAALPVVRGLRRVRGATDVVRLMISYDAVLPEGMTLVYRDVDRAKPARDIATSNFESSNVSTLGSYETLSELRCVVEGGALRVTSPNSTRPAASLAETPFARPAR